MFQGTLQVDILQAGKRKYEAATAQTVTKPHIPALGRTDGRHNGGMRSFSYSELFSPFSSCLSLLVLCMVDDHGIVWAYSSNLDIIRARVPRQHGHFATSLTPFLLPSRRKMVSNKAPIRDISAVPCLSTLGPRSCTQYLI